MKCFLLISIFLISSLAQSKENSLLLASKEQAIGFAISWMNGGKEYVNPGNMRVLEVDLNKDGKLDLWVSESSIMCGSGGCSGVGFLSVDGGFCTVNYKITPREHEFDSLNSSEIVCKKFEYY